MERIYAGNGVEVTPWMCGPPPSTGQRQQFPGRFIYNLKRYYPVEGKKVLSMFSGASDIGTTLDFRSDANADLKDRFDQVSVRARSFDMVIADPPYTTGFGFEWSPDIRDMPKPKHVLREGARIVKKHGLVLILHIMVIPAYKEFGVQRVAMHPVFCGSNNVMRVLNVFRRIQ